MRDWKERKVETFNSSWSVFWLFCLILVLPVWLVDYPPMVDLPGHASQIQLMHNLRDESFLYADLFERYYITAYAGGYFIVYLLSFVFGVLAALKIIITISLLGIPFFTKKIVDHFGGNPAWVWLCFPIAYSNAFYWGFLNYIFTVAIGLGWIFFCLKVSERDKLTWRVQLAIALGVVVLFIGHIIACGMLGLVVAIYYFFLHKTVKQRFLLLTPLLIFIPLLISYLWWTRTGESRGLGSQTRLYYYPERYR